MPETSSTWWGNRSRPASACLMPIRMPKSPQPGHQVDLSPPVNSLISDMDQHLLPDLGGDLGRREWPTLILTNAAVDFPAGPPPDQPGELAGVVLLDGDQASDAAQRLGQPILV